MLLTTKLDPSSLHSNQVDFNSSSLAMPWDTQVHLLWFLLLSSAGRGRKATHTQGTATLRGCRGSAKGNVPSTDHSPQLSLALVSDLQDPLKHPSLAVWEETILHWTGYQMSVSASHWASLLWGSLMAYKGGKVWFVTCFLK